MSNEIEITITSDNRARPGLAAAEHDVKQLTRSVDGAGTRSSALSGVFAKLGTAAAGMVAPMAAAAVRVAAFASTAMSVAPLLAPVVVGIGQVVGAALAAAPALLAMGAAAGVVVLTLKQFAGPLGKALSPIAEGFKKAAAEAAKLATLGVKPLAQELMKANLPALKAMLTDIGVATGNVVAHFLIWGKSSAGMKAISSFTTAVGDAVRHLEGPIIRVGIAFASMLGRISGVSLAAGSAGLGGVLDKLAEKLDKINAKSVGNGIAALIDAFRVVRDFGGKVKDVIGKIVDAYKMYQTQFGALADVVAVAAMAIGGPVTIIIALVGLLIRHFDDVKSAIEKVREYFESPIGQGMFDNLRNAADDVLPALKQAFEDIKENVLPVLQEIADKITQELGPAFTQFLEDAGPFIAWFVEEMGPIISENLKGTLEIVSGFIDQLTGFFTMLSGILTGDWSKAWEGLKQMASGGVRALLGLIRVGLSPLAGVFKRTMDMAKKAVNDAVGGMRSAGRNVVNGISSGIRGAVGLVASAIATVRSRITGFFARAGSWLVGAGRSIIAGLVSGIKSAAGSIKAAVSAAIPDAIERFIPGFAHGGIVGGAAGGGPRSGMVLVGEQGPELVRLPGGSTVIPHGQTNSMLSGSGGGDQRIVVEFTGTSQMDRAFAELMRKFIRVHGGSVQTVLGGG